MSRPVIVGLALREDDAAPIRLALTLAGLSGAPIALVHALPRETPGRLPVPEYTAAIREAAQEQAPRGDRRAPRRAPPRAAAWSTDRRRVASSRPPRSWAPWPSSSARPITGRSGACSPATWRPA